MFKAKKTSNRIKRTKAEIAFDVFNFLILLLLAFIMIYPMYYVFIVSISAGIHVIRGEVSFWPMAPTFEVYRTVLQNPDIHTGFRNTLLYTTVGTAINLVMTTLCAYPLARKDFYGRKPLTFFFLLTMFISGGMIPLYLTVLNLGLINTMWAIVLPPAISTWNMLIMRSFFMNIPESLHESANIDGANDLQVLGRIVLPLSKPVFATMLLFYAVAHWNSWFSAVIYLNQRSRLPLQVFLRDIVITGVFGDQAELFGSAADNFTVVATNYQYAVIIITVIPILLIYPFLQKHFTKGVMIGSIKG